MKFHTWVEAKGWFERLPQKPLDYNKSQIDLFVEAMADKNKNSAALYRTLSRQSYKDTRYDKPIANNLLLYNDVRLKNALGAVHNNVGESEFKFITDGSIRIIHTPVIYDDLDKHLLFSVIIHELSHADHWLRDKRFKPTKFNSFNSEKYVKHWTEARAYSQQLVTLLHRIPNRQSILDAFGRSPTMDTFTHGGKEMVYAKPAVFSWSPLLLDTAKEFLAHYQGRNEGVLSNIAAPLVTGASLLMPQSQMPQKPVNVMQQQVMSQAHEAADLVKQIVDKMLFRNFLIRI
jgi:hypothetical protein